LSNFDFTYITVHVGLFVVEENQLIFFSAVSGSHQRCFMQKAYEVT